MELLDESTLRSILESAPAGILLIDSRGLIFRVTKEAERLTGWSRSELIGKPVETLVPQRLREAHVGKRDGFLANPMRRPMGTGLGLYLLRKDGSELPVDISLAPIAIGKEQMVLAAVLEASPWQKAEHAAAAEERMAFLGLSQMASFVAHQVNTPLTNIALLASATERASQDPRVREYMDRIHKQERSAASIVKNLMNIARIQHLKKEDTDLRTVVDEAIEAVRPSLPPAVSLIREYASVRMVVPIDRLQIKEALVNLLHNAVEATPKGFVTVRLEDGGSEVRISVDDTGVGIPASVIPKLFAPFFTTKTGTGKGLGLAYVKGVVMAHGGTVEVKSTPYRGSTFTVVLPAEPGA